MRKPHGVCGRNGVQIGGSNVAEFGQLTFIPSVAAHPFAGFERRDAFLDSLNGDGDRIYGGVAQIDGIQGIDFLEVAVGVNEPRSNRVALEVDDVSVFRGSLPPRGVRSDGDDLSAGDCNGLRH